MTRFYVERQVWQRWPRVLLMCKDTGNGIERRRYVPEGGTRDEWNEGMRAVMRKYTEAANKLNARLLEESELPNLQAEIVGLKWALNERDALIRDMWFKNLGRSDGGCGWCVMGCENEEACDFERRMRELGITESEES